MPEIGQRGIDQRSLGRAEHDQSRPLGHDPQTHQGQLGKQGFKFLVVTRRHFDQEAGVAFGEEQHRRILDAARLS